MFIFTDYIIYDILLTHVIWFSDKCALKSSLNMSYIICHNKSVFKYTMTDVPSVGYDFKSITHNGGI